LAITSGRQERNGRQRDDEAQASDVCRLICLNREGMIINILLLAVYAAMLVPLFA
jgi:hypothetical protein